jgi:hypothetical protein
MKIWKLFTGAVLVLAGFCAGMVLNFVPLATIVHGAADNSQPALKTVAHNATLAGDGTTTAPLTIANAGVGTAQLANGGVNASKLSTSATPSPGQVLGFNGNLAWQNAPVGGVRVVDTNGKEVGPLIGSTFALRKVANFTFAIEVVPSGFPDNGPFLYAYTSYDCSGTQYLGMDSTRLITPSRQSGTVLEYLTGPFERVTINSYEETSYGGNSKFCIHFPNHDTNIYGRSATFDLSTLNLTPPFHLEF